MSQHWEWSAAPPHWRLPLHGAGEIRWNAQGVPYIRADNNHDAALLLGAASYTLRACQIQLFRHVAWGRLAEIGGPRFVRIDTLIRTLDLHRAQGETLRGMPADTRAWIEAFCTGLNAVAAASKRGRDMRILGLHHAPFTAEDILAIGRLTGTDVNWPLLFDLFPLRSEPGFSAIWRRVRQMSGTRGARDTDTLDWLLHANHDGSNCLALAGSRTLHGKPILAGDPHLNHQLPNLWLLAGLACPAVQAVGFVFPGLPVIGLGRNPHLAWGGTNLRAASSDLVELNETELKNCTQTVTRIRVRGWKTITRTLRSTLHGPVISDALPGSPQKGKPAIALRWAGHWPSDEISAFLNIMRLQTATGLQMAVRPYAVTGLNLLAADTAGHISQTHAAWLPKRHHFPADDMVISSSESLAQWRECLNSADLPFTIDPPSGFIASTNQQPEQAPPISFFFNGLERNQRLCKLIIDTPQWTRAQVEALQCDVVSEAASALSTELADWIDTLPAGQEAAAITAALRQWNGAYRTDSHQALLFESLLRELRHQLATRHPTHAAWWVMQEWAYITHYFLDDIRSLTMAKQSAILKRAIQQTRGTLRRYSVWGEVHRLAPRHVLSGLPVVGKRWFPSLDLPAAGSRETLMKNAHGWVHRKAGSTYGAQARQICELNEPDANYFVLLGGQDENPQSPHALDQATLWVDSKYVQMPLTQEAVDRQFGRVWIFRPSAGAD